MLGMTWPAVMGVVNVTPDSFSDGGRFLDAGVAVERGLELAAAGAAILDVGGESTRPGAAAVDGAEEARRVVGVIRRLHREAGVPVSVDTRKAVVAAAALEAGAGVVNDVSAGADPEMLPLVAEAGCGYVAMHMRGTPATMQDDPRYDDVVGEVAAYLAGRLDAAREAGVAGDRLLADPGIGFGKTAAHNAALLVGLPRLVEALGVPVLVGTSRKAFVGAALAEPGGAPLPLSEREEGTLATVVLALEGGASLVRVHEAAPSVTAVRLLTALARARPDDPDPPTSWRPPAGATREPSCTPEP